MVSWAFISISDLTNRESRRCALVSHQYSRPMLRPVQRTDHLTMMTVSGKPRLSAKAL